jgi:hypothetical protein
MVTQMTQEWAEEGLGLQIALSRMLQEMEKEHMDDPEFGWRLQAAEQALRRLREAA